MDRYMYKQEQMRGSSHLLLIQVHVMTIYHIAITAVELQDKTAYGTLQTESK